MAQSPNTSGQTQTTETLEERINREYRAMTRPADKAAFQRALKDAGLPAATADTKVSARSALITELLKLKK